MRNGGGIGQGRRIELRRDFDATQLRRLVEALALSKIGSQKRGPAFNFKIFLNIAFFLVISCLEVKIQSKTMNQVQRYLLVFRYHIDDSFECRPRICRFGWSNILY
jgi:hypothetical protein